MKNKCPFCGFNQVGEKSDLGSMGSICPSCHPEVGIDNALLHGSVGVETHFGSDPGLNLALRLTTATNRQAEQQQGRQAKRDFQS